ncbi:hypothetical protein [Streptomyces sp. SID12488]|uniref:hypothetical protein n=1 Tax=Streptomyces sp. SID12488 TaxID=2706040 RepID=UPI0013DA0921|nr:hypothetical protein [Streptomyces sp. SID12488]NEA67040.1 hypothetical protein [Streptomyces sp. SID12488]
MIMDLDASSETPEAPGTPGGHAPAPSRRIVIVGEAAVAGAGGLTVAATSARTAQAAPATAVADWGACLTVARAILVRDDEDQPFVPRYADILLNNGLPRSRRPGKKVLIVGAGPAPDPGRWAVGWTASSRPPHAPPTVVRARRPRSTASVQRASLRDGSAWLASEVGSGTTVPANPRPVRHPRAGAAGFARARSVAGAARSGRPCPISVLTALGRHPLREPLPSRHFAGLPLGTGPLGKTDLDHL